LGWYKRNGNSPPFGNADVSFLGDAVNVAPRWPATEPVYDSAGNYWVHRPGYGVPDTWNPLASAKEPFIDNNTNRNAINAYFEFKILSGLTLRITGGAIIENVNNHTYYNQKTYEGRQNTGLGIVDAETNSRYQNSNILTTIKYLNNTTLLLRPLLNNNIRNTTCLLFVQVIFLLIKPVCLIWLGQIL
jgi:hypothetical protein